MSLHIPIFPLSSLFIPLQASSRSLKSHSQHKYSTWSSAPAWIGALGHRLLPLTTTRWFSIPKKLRREAFCSSLSQSIGNSKGDSLAGRRGKVMPGFHAGRAGKSSVPAAASGNPGQRRGSASAPAFPSHAGQSRDPHLGRTAGSHSLPPSHFHGLFAPCNPCLHPTTPGIPFPEGKLSGQLPNGAITSLICALTSPCSTPPLPCPHLYRNYQLF